MCEYTREGLENAPSANVDNPPPAKRLADERRAFTSALIEPDALALYRLIVADGWRFPDLSRVFDQSGMRIIRRRIAQLLESGGVPANKSRQVAAEVVAMVLGDAYQRAVLGIVEEGDSEAFAQQIAAAIAYALSRRAWLCRRLLPMEISVFPNAENLRRAIVSRSAPPRARKPRQRPPTLGWSFPPQHSSPPVSTARRRHELRPEF
jgi:hypothetical protein